MERKASKRVDGLGPFKDRLKKAGARATPQRLEVYQAVASSRDHPDVETVYRRVRNKLPTVSLDTVYRTLGTLQDLGLIMTLGPARGPLKYDGNTVSHHHFHCVKCGLIRDFYSPEFDRLGIPESIKAWGSAEKTQVEVRGVCRACLHRVRHSSNGALNKK
jgi:Fur family peroxide stress response transcriptional regulator